MEQVTNKENCTGCSACIAVCRQKAINMKINEEGFWYPNINQDKCSDCNICINICPINNNIKNNDMEPLVFACYSKNNDLREKSSSGGIFSVLAQSIFNSSGVVFGAAYNTKFLVYHTEIEDFKCIDKLQGSKYVQSYIGNSFKKVKNYLDHGRKVMFIGLPCQIAGLKNYLKKEYNNLYCIDLICYGASSPLIWRSYLNQVHGKGDIQNINFKDKTIGWSKPCIKIVSNNGFFLKDLSKDIYGKNYSLFFRPSCYQCKFKGNNRKSDITLGDCWGIENLPIKNDELGISTIIINTEKGKELWNSIENQVISKKININFVKIHNIMYEKSVFQPPNQKLFYSLQKSVKFKYAVIIYKIINYIMITFNVHNFKEK